MYRKTLTVALVALVTAAAWGQAARAPYVGEVTGDNVYVRSGPGDSYPCTKVSRPARVRVVAEKFGWLKIKPPPGCFSLISKRYVEVDGNTGTVTGTNVLVRAGSELFPTRKEAIQTRLNIDDKVEVVGSADDYWKITPPPGAHLWISSQYVRPVGAAPTTRLAAPPERKPPERKPPERKPPERKPPERKPPERKPPERKPPARRTLERHVDAFNAAEANLTAEHKKPREQRDFQGLLEQYRAINVPDGDALQPYVDARIKFLQDEIATAEDLKEVEALMADLQQKQARLKAVGQEIEVPAKSTARTYAAEGVLSPSGLFPGGPTGPKRYIISDPETRVIYGYVQCTTGMVDLDRHVGAYVGVVGRPKYDERLRTFVYEAQEVIVLRAAGSEMQPKPAPSPAPAPAPTPAPKPAPKPAPAPKPVPVPAPKPVPAPAPKPAPVPAPKPAPAPTTRPAAPPWAPEPDVPVEDESGEPLPPTGLPVAGSTTQPAVDPEEYE